MSEFFLCEIENIEKSGVEIKVTGTRFKKDDDDDCIRTVRTVCFDFTKHDNVFEDKIANLEKQIDRLNGEKSILRTRCMPYIERDFDNGLYGKLAIVGCNEEFVDIQKYADGDDFYSREVRNLISEGGIKRLIGQYRNISARLDKISAENKKLKQRIAGLEKELEEWKEEARAVKKNRDEQLKSFRKAVEPYVDIGHIHETIGELKQRISELESKETSELPFDALECANYLINATYERETSSLERIIANTPDKVNSDRYTVDELEQIAEHLLVYCKHNKECEE